jgi:hypothetical protein
LTQTARVGLFIHILQTDSFIAVSYFANSQSIRDCHNNPIKYYDPTGYSATAAQKKAIEEAIANARLNAGKSTATDNAVNVNTKPNSEYSKEVQEIIKRAQSRARQRAQYNAMQSGKISYNYYAEISRRDGGIPLPNAFDVNYSLSQSGQDIINSAYNAWNSGAITIDELLESAWITGGIYGLGALAGKSTTVWEGIAEANPNESKGTGDINPRNFQALLSGASMPAPPEPGPERPVTEDSIFFLGYQNTIVDNGNGIYSVTTIIGTLFGSITTTYEFANGVTQFNFTENNYLGVFLRGGGKDLAEAMYKAAKFIDSDYLSDRTIGGINSELLIHDGVTIYAA